MPDDAQVDSEMLNGIFDHLDGDTVLEGANYLDGSGKIQASPTRPKVAGADHVANPSMTLVFNITEDPDTKQHIGLLFVNVFADKLDNDTPDRKRLEMCHGRVYYLLDSEQLNHPDHAIHYSECVRLSKTPPLRDPEDEHEDMMTAVYQVTATNANWLGY